MYSQMSADSIAYYETQIDQQSQLLDAYKNKLEDEQEALQESLDKRKEMYEKYFDALDEEESDENFEEEQARLQRAIASLSTATDATSLTKLKEYQDKINLISTDLRVKESKLKFLKETEKEKEKWVTRFIDWMRKYNRFLSQLTYDEYGNSRYTHERLIKAQNSIMRLLKEGTMFTYFDEQLRDELDKIPRTNNQIEGGINSRLREMLRVHRGLSVERRIKAVFWWCYMHSPEPLSVSTILETMPTDKSINDIYMKMTKRERIQDSIPYWGDAVAWGELHHSADYPANWD